MKTLSRIALASLIVTFFTAQSFASDPNSKLVEKAKEAVANADTDDWETLAQSAEICFMKDENVEEAAIWINQSIQIKETAYNLEVKGDYLSSIGEKQEAIRCYYTAIIRAKDMDPDANTSKLQRKVWKLR
ncbi:MAG: hypothetical protein ABJ004_15555 [Cyclobacteriaceae bacterium]